MKTLLLLVSALIFASSTCEAAPLAESASAITTIGIGKLDATSDLGLFKRKKYKYKKRRNVNRSRYHRGGLFGR